MRSGKDAPDFSVLCPVFRVQGSGLRVQGSGFRVQGSGFRVQGSLKRRARMNEIGQRCTCLQGLGFGVLGLVFEV